MQETIEGTLKKKIRLEEDNKACQQSMNNLQINRTAKKVQKRKKITLNKMFTLVSCIL